MNRKEFIKNMGAAVGFAALGLGCSKEATANEASSAGGDAKALASAKNKGDKKMKCAVVYYSWSGNTRFAAETIAKKTGADLFEIKAGARPRKVRSRLRRLAELVGHDGAARAHLGRAEQGRAQGQDRMPFPDARRRRNAARRQRIRGHRRLHGESTAAQGVQRLVDQVQRRRAGSVRHREDCRQVTLACETDRT